ncbi:MAG TPA: hypothetical protein VFQ22_04015 [Longimicrobiales bacterium]|nr:hypothetical protein [Longimicrobiales bacterium]
MDAEESPTDSWEGTTQEIAVVHLETGNATFTGAPRDEAERYAEGSEERMLANERSAGRARWRRICFRA